MLGGTLVLRMPTCFLGVALLWSAVLLGTAGGVWLKRGLTALQAKTLLASVRPPNLTGRTRRELAVELISEVQVLDGKLKALTRRLAQAVTAAGPGLTGVYGIGPAAAARILADVGDVARFADRSYGGFDRRYRWP